MFLALMVAGLVGLVMMALPALARHGGGGQHHLGAVKHGALPAHGAGHAAHATHTSDALVKQSNALAAAESPRGIVRLVPSPRAVCSLLALYGAFANALVRSGHLTPLVAALVAALPAIAVERLAVTPLWRLLFRFQGHPSSPLEELILAEATAVTAFRNGRGLVSLVRDGRLVQFAATLVEAQAGRTVRVGDRLRVEDVDARRERLTVALAEE
jgi:hypothetical protein